MAIYQTIISTTGAKVHLDDRYFTDVPDKEIERCKKERDRVAGEILKSLAARMQENK